MFRGSYIIRSVAKSITEIKTSELYANGQFKDDLEKLCASDRQAESDQKNALLQNQYTVPTGKDGLAMLQELYVIESEEPVESKERGEKEDMDDIDDLYVPEEDQIFEKTKRRTRVITKVGDVVIRDELMEYSDFPFLAYQPERYGGQIYHAAWIEPLIQLNKALDGAISNRQEWLETFAKGRWLVRKDAKMSVLRNKNGQIVQYEGQAPTMLQASSLPQEANVHIADMERYMEDIGGQHSESLGRLSGGATSGVAIAQLQAADLNNISEPVDNLKTMLEEVAYRILSLASDYLALKTVSDENNVPIKMVGANLSASLEKRSKAEGGRGKIEAVKIKPLRNIEVEIIPGSAFSDLQMRQDLIELRNAQVPIPDEFILKAYKLGNTRNLLDAYIAERDEMQMGADGIDGLEAKQAELENQKLINGIVIVPQDGENHEIHMAVHGSALQGLDPNSPQAQALMQHAQSHEAMVSG